MISSCFSLQLKEIIPDTRLKSVPKINTEMSKLHKQNNTEFLHVYIQKEHILNKPEEFFFNGTAAFSGFAQEDHAFASEQL